MDSSVLHMRVNTTSVMRMSWMSDILLVTQTPMVYTTVCQHSSSASHTLLIFIILSSDFYVREYMNGKYSSFQLRHVCRRRYLWAENDVLFISQLDRQCAAYAVSVCRPIHWQSFRHWLLASYLLLTFVRNPLTWSS